MSAFRRSGRGVGEAAKPLSVLIVAGEASGDQLGAPLMAALRERLSGQVQFRGVGGSTMQAQGLQCLFPMEDLTAIGIDQVLRKLPTILRRMRELVATAAAEKPDLAILIDSPDFNLRLAKRLRRRMPSLPIVDYVSPTVWVWRPRRAKAMRPNVDHVLALYPFEPAVLERLGGPPSTYVGHPLLERLSELRPSAVERAIREASEPTFLVLPGSRNTEIQRLSPVFGETIGRLAELRGRIDFALPTLPSKLAQIETAIATWPVKPRIVTEEKEKFAAFRRARAALAASGTVTLELALAEVPTVAAYKVSRLEAPIARRVIRSPSAILPNLIIGENVVPEFHQERCTADNLVAALEPLFEDSAERRRQTEGFAKLAEIMKVGDERPSVRAARVTLEVFEKKTGRADIPLNVIPAEAEGREPGSSEIG
ncbi:MAG TPA: lipid-A-disaccharide synthase [Xanthobacteraceae bacterium]|nr:lipid-A-disaccharide synthase [Xanthobacteraceae bacterium]